MTSIQERQALATPPFGIPRTVIVGAALAVHNQTICARLAIPVT